MYYLLIIFPTEYFSIYVLLVDFAPRALWSCEIFYRNLYNYYKEILLPFNDILYNVAHWYTHYCINQTTVITNWKISTCNSFHLLLCFFRLGKIIIRRFGNYIMWYCVQRESIQIFWYMFIIIKSLVQYLEHKC